MPGASFGTVEALLAGETRINPAMLATSALLITASIALSHYLRKREERHEISANIRSPQGGNLE